MEKEYIGIDYGMGVSNRDKDNSEYHYGIISAHNVPYIWDSVESDYGEPTCPKCGTAASDFDDIYNAKTESEQGWIDDFERQRCCCDDYICLECEYVFDSSEAFSDEPLGHYFEDSEYTLWIDSINDLWILKSPYYTRAAYCSPCAPGAGSLNSPRENGIKTYCLGLEWFPEHERKDFPVPYPIYNVADDTQIYTPENASE